MTRTSDTILDEALVLAAQAGDAVAFQDLLRRWLPMMRRHAARLTGNSSAADDVAQDACLALVSGLRRLSDPARARGWALRIVTNKAADWVRRRQRDRALAQTIANSQPRPASSDTDSGEGNDARAAAIRDACQELPTELRAAISLYYGEGLSVAQVAAVLGVKVGTMKFRLHEARTQLKDILERNTS